MVILTIGITSYNRVYELNRCLKSINTKYYNSIEIVVSEDKSPKREKIKEVVLNYKKESPYKVIFNSNENNLGYDRNLKKIISLSTGKYLLYVSDDDMIAEGELDKLIEVLVKVDVGVVYSGFSLGKNDYRRFYKNSYPIPKGAEYLKKHIEDSILFSGLVFNVNLVKEIDAERFVNKNYFQVYLYMYAIFNYGGYYLGVSLINAMGDGENGFGLSDSSEKNELLANRDSVFSMLEFHKGLLAIIKQFDIDYGTDFFKYYEKEYNLRSISGMTIARKSSKKVLKNYWKKMNELDISPNIISKSYYFMLYLLGEKTTTLLLSIPKKCLKAFRNEN